MQWLCLNPLLMLSDESVAMCTQYIYIFFSLMENVRVKRAGYAFRQKYEQFLYRYKMLCADTWPHWQGARPQEGVQILLERLHITQEEFAFGRTKLFIRNPITVSLVGISFGGS